jgi:CBS domain-containing protein
MKLARDIMTKNPIVLVRRDTIKKAIAVLVAECISGAPVVDEATGKMVGLVSEYDLILAIHSVGSGVDVADAMKQKVMSVTETTPVEDVADLMLVHKIRRVPVLDEQGRPSGMISRREILKAYYADIEQKGVVRPAERD